LFLLLIESAKRMNEVKGDRLYVNISASQARRRLKGFGHGVRKVQSAGKNQAVIIHTATGQHLEELENKFADVGCSSHDDSCQVSHITIRPETATDHEAIRQVNLLAFGQEAEGELVDMLREQGYVRLSLVAERDSKIVGHILFSAIQIGAEDALALAPMAVVPDHQRRGIGSALIQTGLEQCRQAGHRIVIVLGHPDYYPRFGFLPELAAPLKSKYAGEAFMALELVPGALDGVTGEVKYPPPFDAI
jgi:putative acetyltransferase